MNESVLVPVSELVRLQPEVFRRVEALQPPLAADMTSGEAGEALARSLLFEHWPELVDPDLDPIRAFYNRYFWFRRFATLWQQARGSDAGLEQQVFQLLENAEPGVDWNIVEGLEARATSGDLP